MKNKVLLLTRVQLMAYTGINRMRIAHGAKERRRAIGMTVLYIVLIPIMCLYIAGAAYTLSMLGLGKYIPAFCALLAGVVMFFVVFLKASAMLFGGSDHDMLAALPISSRTLLVSRFLTIYFYELPFCLLTTLSGCVVYCIMERPGAVFYILFLPLTLILPFVPLTLASAVGTFISWASARFRAKNVVAIVLQMAFIILILVGQFVLSTKSTQMDEAALANSLSSIMDGTLRVFPPCVWYGSALLGDPAGIALYISVSCAVFAVFIYVAAHAGDKMRESISSRKSIAADTSKYKSSTPFFALYKKEIRRYFSSSLYVLNTGFGAVMMLIIAGIAAFSNLQSFINLFMPGVSAESAMAYMPLIMAAIAALAPSTASAISLEGKKVWISASLPVKMTEICDAKSAVYITIMAPAAIIAGAVMIVFIKMTPVTAALLILAPICYAGMSSQVGLAFDLAKPKYNYRNEAQVIKQSSSVMMAMLVGMASSILPIVLAAKFSFIDINGLTALLCVITLAAAFILRARNVKKRL